MPLIDDSNQLLDRELMAEIASDYTQNNGHIIDQNGNTWIRWRVDGLDAWWRLFEEIIDKPMGRRLANSACDEEEHLLSEGIIDATGLFKTSKVNKLVEKRWRVNGWGSPNYKKMLFSSKVLTPIMAGIFQAQKEKMDSTRYKMRWENKSADDCMLSFEQSSHIIQPASGKLNSLSPGIPYTVEVESDWKIDGVSHFLLPSGLFIRLQQSCAGLTANLSDDERNCWPSLDDGFLSLAIASKKLFIAGQEIFLAADADGWKENCAAHFGSIGLSIPSTVEMIDSRGAVRLNFNELRNPALSIGCLAGAWERCEGRPVKVSYSISDQKHVITLQSKYEMSQIGD